MSKAKTKAKKEVPVADKLVVYTDGGCRPKSRGTGGFGLHGYFYYDETPNTGSGLKDHHPTAKGYHPKAGKGNDPTAMTPDGPIPAVTVTEYVDGWGSIIPESTNNISELKAAIRAAEVALERKVRHVLFNVDSRYVLDGITEWYKGWERNNWLTQGGKEVANQSYWKELVAAVRALEASGCTLEWKWVKGHDGEIGNEKADDHASWGVIAGFNGVDQEDIRFTKSTGYWSPKAEVNRMFAQSKWYFNTGAATVPMSPCGRHVYHLGEHGTEDDFLGKPMPDATYSVIYLKEPEEVLEKVRMHQRSLDPYHFDRFVIGRLENLFRPTTYLDTKTYGTIFFQRINQKYDLFDPNEVPLTRDLDPPRLAFNMVGVLTTLEGLLDNVVAGKADNCVITDITDHLYDREEKAKKVVMKLKGTITTSTKSLSLPIHYDTGKSEGCLDTTLTVGLDTPTRNSLAALASQNPTVRVVSWKESDNAFRYATVVETDDDAGIWAGFYSNLRLLTT